jgi:hypothetical protein
MVDHLGIYVIESSHGVDCFYHGVLILCQSHHGIHGCILGRAIVLGGNGMGSNT